MTAYDDIQTAKGAVDQLKEGANAINEWAEKATELAEAGKELTKIQGVLKGVKVFGKLGTGFAMAGIGLDLALFAFGIKAPDPNEMILNAISALDNKVDALWNAMDQQFDKIHTHLDTVSAKQRIQDEMEYFSALKKIIMVYRESPPSGTQLLLDSIYSPAAIHKNFSGIHDAVMSDKADDNILKAEYDSTCGEASTIINTGKELLAVALLAPMAYALASALRHKKDTTFELATPYDVDKLFGKLINAISEQISKYTKMCWDEAKTNVKKKMERDIFPNLEVPGNREIGATFRPSSKYLCEVIARQWPMFDWVVVVGRWDIKNFHPPMREEEKDVVRLVWSKQKIKNCNVYVDVMGGSKGKYIPTQTLRTDKDVAWSCYWTNPKRIHVQSYHPKWLTDEQIMELNSDKTRFYNSDRDYSQVTLESR
ncbi:hypothetical protein [Candidatus Villigracilis affinis]|uniref:hypothetical protein n=1 Tax=Candidatus Villigracilis affinis TaxID=3140682 RepID=UPI002A20A9F1|nr:hypothetical protein [Anaerolineales bacterium]